MPGVAFKRGMTHPVGPAGPSFSNGSRPSVGSARALQRGTDAGKSQCVLRDRSVASRRSVARDRAVGKGHRVRRGLTLLELLLVLVVVVAVLALAWPALDRPFANQRLRRAADQVRAAIARARNRAMVEGVPYEFRFVPGGSEFQTGAYVALAEGDSPTATAAAPAGDTSVAPGGRRGSMLPPDVYFAANAPAAGAAADSAAAGADIYVPQADGWSAPIVLFPDGTGTSATITLANDAGRMIDVHLRGLSGSARVSEPYTAANGP